MYAVAAALVILVGANWWMQYREQSIDVDVSPARYRIVFVDVVGPESGDLPTPPNELRWKAVPNATRYDVEIHEVDLSPLWGASTTETHVTLPPDARAQFKPGKLLLWSVSAYRDKELLGTSQTQNVRVHP